MIHPSYVELMKVVNDGVEIGEEPVVNSRYSIVLATAKRARQIIDGAKPYVSNVRSNKPLSIAVDELFHGDVKIVSEEDMQRGEQEPAEENLAALEPSGDLEEEAGSAEGEELPAEDEDTMAEKE